MLDLTTLETFISRDVKFYEHIFPFKDTDSITRSINPLSPHITPNLITPGTCDDPDPTHTQHHPDTQPSIQNSPQPNPFSKYQLRRSTRQCAQPKYLNDYLCYNVTMDSKPLYPIQNYINYSKLTTHHTYYICQIYENHEPQTYKQAIKFPQWKQAIQDELIAMDLNNTWTIIQLPPNKKPITCKWLFKLKLNSDGTVAKHKARLVARGFTQQYGLDFQETFSPVAKITTLILLFVSCCFPALAPSSARCEQCIPQWQPG